MNRRTFPVFVESLACAWALTCLAGSACGAESPASAAAASASAPSAAEDGIAPPSRAENLLFSTPQLASLHEPMKLHYDYEDDEGKVHTADHVTLVLAARPNGSCCATHVDYRSGAAEVSRADLDDPGTNPVLLHFLVEQVQTISRATQGQPTHFQRRMRQALADEAVVKDTTVRWEGKDVPAQVVHIAPFIKDPYRVRFEHEARTEYEFVLSQAVPGGIVRLSETLPGEKEGDPPLSQRTLSLVDPQPAPPARK
ncbi:MAG TPA: hypothetical protein VH328_01290 [Burkholderiaceae bacterium]|nr:hypothetical protein [Burkholderiaceae bacterium]